MNDSFKVAYGVLQQHAETLRDQKEPNIDDLLTIVTESVEAFKVCQFRIEAVEKALEKALSDVGRTTTQIARESRATTSAASVDEQDRDIPF